MEAYPEGYTVHNLPLVILSGLGSESNHDVLAFESQELLEDGITISSESPLVTGERAEQLLQDFRKADGTERPWNGRLDRTRGELIGLKLRTVGRVGQAHSWPQVT